VQPIMANLEFQRLNETLLLHRTRDRGRQVRDRSLAALCMKLTKATVTARDLIERNLMQTMVFPLVLTDIDETTKDPSRPIETKIGPHLMGIIDKFPDLKEQWETMSPAYYETLRTHEQWCLLFSTPPTLANPAIRLPAHAPHGQSHVPSSPTPVPNSAPTPPLPTQTGGAPSANPVPPPNPAFPPLQPVGGIAGSTYAGTVRDGEPSSALVLDMPLRNREKPAAPAGSNIQLPPAPTPFHKTRTKPGDRPSSIAPGLDTPGFWCAGKTGKHLSHNQRPGGRLDTHVIAKFDESNKEAKKESKPERLNLCHNEDPHICWKIFGARAGCPYANDESECKYYHHVHQSLLDIVVANRGVNKEYIAWMINNYKRNVPASHQQPLVMPTAQSAFAPPGNSQYRPAAAGTQTGPASSAGTQPLFSDPAPYVPQPLQPVTNTANIRDASIWEDSHQNPPLLPVAPKQSVAPKRPVAKPAARGRRYGAAVSSDSSDSSDEE
jgi:hypothetical protein